MAKVLQMKRWGLPVITENLPRFLRGAKRWVLWKAAREPDGRVAKRPHQVGGRMASHSDPDTWTTYEAVIEAYNAGGYDGVGFVISDAPVALTIVDLDKCRDPDTGLVEKWAQRIIDSADTYTEVSPSGAGVRLVLKGDTHAFINHADRVEVYTQESKRFLTLTGHVIEDRHSVAAKPSAALLEVLEPFRRVKSTGEGSGEKVTDSPEEIRRILLSMDLTKHEEYSEWLELGMALHHQFDGDVEGLDLWDECSQVMNNYEGRDILEVKWDSFGSGSRDLTLRTFFKRAKAEGVNIRPSMDPGEFPDLDDEEDPFVESVPEPAGWLLSGLQMLSAPPPRQLVQDLLARKMVSMVSGPPGAGKSFFALHLAYCVARGEPFFGRKVAQGNVVYLAYEGLFALQQRARAMKKATGRGWPLGLWAGIPEVGIAEDKWASKLGADLVAAKPKLVVIDTLSAATPGLNLNDEGPAKALMQQLLRWAEKWDMHVMILHHPPKGGEMASSRSRGSGALDGALDTQLFVIQDRDTRVVTARVEKQRGLGSSGDEFMYMLKGVETDMMTEWGPERGAWLSEEVSETDRASPSVLELRERLRDAIMANGNMPLDAGGWLTVKEAWTGEHFPGMTEAAVKGHVKRALREISDELYVVRNGGNRITEVGYVD